MITAFSTHSLSVSAVQRTPERGIATPLGLSSNARAQHAAPRRQPGSSAVTLRAGGIDPTPSDSREAAGGVQISPLHAVSDQPVGRCICRGDRCVRLTQTGRLIADALCVGIENERNQEAAYRLNTRNSTTKLIPGAGVTCARDASDQGSGVERTEGVQSPHLNCPTVLIAGGVGQHGRAPLMHASSHEIESVETFSRKEFSMGLRGPQRPLTQVAMDAAEEAEDSAIAYTVTVRRSIADGQVTDAEVLAIAVADDRMRRAHRAATIATEHADIAQVAAANLMRGGIAESTRDRARHAGLIVPDFRIDMPQDAA